MILIRDIFHCKPGKVRPLVDKFKAVNAAMAKAGFGSSRITTDLSGADFWTVVSEWEAESLQDYDETGRKMMDVPGLDEIMKGYHELVERGRREIFTIES